MLNILIICLTIIEVKTGKIYDYNTIYGKEEDAFAAGGPDQIDAKLWADALRGLVNKLKGGKFGIGDGLDEDKLETQSLPGRLNI